MTSFAWDDCVKGELKRMLADAQPTLNCTAILNNSHIQDHFVGWHVNQFGSFVQDPAVGAEPIIITLDGGVQWNVTASKKTLATAGESVVEKEMLCFQTDNKPIECCVSKLLLKDPPIPEGKQAMAKARLQNF